MLCVPHRIDWIEVGGVQVPVIDVRSDLHAREPQLGGAAPHFLHGQFWSLHGQRPQPHKALGEPAHCRRQVIIQDATQVQCVIRSGLFQQRAVVYVRITGVKSSF